jgi:glycosyltransferase involved in cell wall biosynthesis
MSRSWTINGRFLTQNVTGVQRYGREILRALDLHLDEGHPLASDLHLELLVPQSNTYIPPLKCITVRKAGATLSGHLWEQIALPLFARNGILSLCNTSTVASKKQIVCIHDLNTLAYPASYSFAFRMLYGVIIPRVVNIASGVATVSHHSANQMARHGLIAQERVRVVPDGHEHVRQWRPDPARPAGSIADGNTIVVIGSPAPHKNVDLILGLAPELSRNGIRIAVVGRLDARVFRGSGLNAATDSISWVGPVTDGELMAIYQNCLCLAFPSRAEGFGLPPLEAMALGCPVVSSDCASMPEVCGDAALYASPDDRGAWLRAFLALRNDPELRRRLIQKGIERAGLFTWRRSAELYLELMSTLDSGDQGKRGRGRNRDREQIASLAAGRRGAL